MDIAAISDWFAALGISPLLAGLALGLLLGFVVFRRRDAATPVVGKTGLPPARSPAFKQGASLRFDQAAQISIDNNGQQIELPAALSAEIFALIEQGNKIEAIKRVREASGLDLLAAKNFVELIERTHAL